MGREFLPDGLPPPDLSLFRFSCAHDGLSPRRFSSNHIISVNIQSEGRVTLPETWPYFLSAVAETLSCGYGAAHTLRSAWVAPQHGHAEQRP